MVSNIKNGLLQVYVLQPKKMEFIPTVVEALVGSSISLPLAVASCIYTGTLLTSKELCIFAAVLLG